MSSTHCVSGINAGMVRVLNFIIVLNKITVKLRNYRLSSMVLQQAHFDRRFAKAIFMNVTKDIATYRPHVPPGESMQCSHRTHDRLQCIIDAPHALMRSWYAKLQNNPILRLILRWCFWNLLGLKNCTGQVWRTLEYRYKVGLTYSWKQISMLTNLERFVGCYSYWRKIPFIVHLATWQSK